MRCAGCIVAAEAAERATATDSRLKLPNLLSPPPEAGGAPSAARFYDAGMSELWGAETRKAIDNFPVSGRPIPVGVVRWLGRIKAAAARVNADLGLLDARARRSASPPPATPSPPASTTTSSRSTSSRPAREPRPT